MSDAGGAETIGELIDRLPVDTPVRVGELVVRVWAMPDHDRAAENGAR